MVGIWKVAKEENEGVVLLLSLEEGWSPGGGGIINSRHKAKTQTSCMGTSESESESDTLA